MQRAIWLAGKKAKLEAAKGARRLRRTINVTHPDGSQTSRELILTNKDEVNCRTCAIECMCLQLSLPCIQAHLLQWKGLR